MMQQSHMQNPKSSGCVLKLLDFGDRLSQASMSLKPQNDGRADAQQQFRRKADDFSYWQDFVESFFSPKGILKLTLWSASEDSTKQFEVSNAGLSRYFFLHFQSGIQKIQMALESAVERPANSGIRIVDAISTFIYWSSNGHQASLSPNAISLFAYFDHISLCQRASYTLSMIRMGKWMF